MANDDPTRMSDERRTRLGKALRGLRAPWAEPEAPAPADAPAPPAAREGPAIPIGEPREATRGPELVVEAPATRGPEVSIGPTISRIPPQPPAPAAPPPAPPAEPAPRRATRPAAPAPSPAPPSRPPATPVRAAETLAQHHASAWEPIEAPAHHPPATRAPAPLPAPTPPTPPAWAPVAAPPAAPPTSPAGPAGAPRRAGFDPAVEEARELRRRADELLEQAKQRRLYATRAQRIRGQVEGAAAELGYAPRPITEIPPLAPGTRQVSMQAIVPERAFVRIVHNQAAHTHTYEVIEPQLSKNERDILDFLRDTLIRTLESGQPATPEERQRTLLDAARRAAVDHAILIDDVGRARVEYHLLRDFLGFGPIDVLMRDPMIEDISCDGPDIPVYLFHREHESLRTTVVFPSDLDLDSFVIRLAQRSGKHISIADPLLDATLPDGSRLQATLSREITTRGSSFTIRKFRADPLTPTDLVRYGTLSPEMAAYFWFAMENGQSLLLAGGTASGKTTSLNAVCQFIPPAKKIVSIEDTREINLSHENWIAGLTRTGFGDDIVGGKQAGTIDMYKLLEAALRQRPEYLLVGEVRGPEALTLFQAMATGHAVYSTMHADSVPSAVYRLENPPINVPRIMLQTLDIVAVQVQARRKDRLVRRIKEVVEVVGFEPETRELLTNTVFEWDSRSDRHRYLGKSFVLDQVMEKRNLSEAQVDAEFRNRVRVLEWMQRHAIRHYAEFSRIVQNYYRDPQALLRRVAQEAPRGPA